MEIELWIAFIAGICVGALAATLVFSLMIVVEKDVRLSSDTPTESMIDQAAGKGKP